MTKEVNHEKIFTDICNKLNELSTQAQEDDMNPPQPKYEQMQNQMKKFHTELQGSHEELREKIKTLENVSYGPETLDPQMKQLVDQLSQERSHNTKLSADLAKSLELSLHLQLEIQGLKARSLQTQSEDKKYSQALFDKTQNLLREVELLQALKDETANELAKAKAAYAQEQANWVLRQTELETIIHNLSEQKLHGEANIAELEQHLSDRDEQIASLEDKIEELSTSYSEVEASAQQQNDVLKNLMSVAETKIVEMKLALDKKSLEAQDYYSHLQKNMTQLEVLKQENSALKEYVAKLNYYHQQAHQAQMAAAQIAHTAAAAATHAQANQPIPQNQGSSTTV